MFFSWRAFFPLFPILPYEISGNQPEEKEFMTVYGIRVQVEGNDFGAALPHCSGWRSGSAITWREVRSTWSVGRRCSELHTIPPGYECLPIARGETAWSGRDVKKAKFALENWTPQMWWKNQRPLKLQQFNFVQMYKKNQTFEENHTLKNENNTTQASIH
jgi:hypothetical protein